MLFYIARQPIFDRMKDIVAYELLYRNANVSSAQISDGDLATSQVLLVSSLVASFSELSNNKRTFINFTKNLIMKDIPLMMSKVSMVSEILEDIVPDPPFLAKLKELSEKGCMLALDDFTLAYKYMEILDYIDIVKVDFRLTTPGEQSEIIKRHKRYGLKFLAEKVETAEEFNRAQAMGYNYFQGYYFAKPSLLRYQDINSLSSTHFEMLKALDIPHVNYADLASILETDVSLSYKLFKYANSPIYGGVEETNSVKSALVRLGIVNIRRWMYLVILRSLSAGQTDELICFSLQRAKMMELMSVAYDLERPSEHFLVGLFSMLHILMNRPIEKILDQLPLTSESKEAIIHQENGLGKPLRLISDYEKGDWQKVEALCNELKMTAASLSDIYIESLNWANGIIAFTQ